MEKAETNEEKKVEEVINRCIEVMEKKAKHHQIEGVTKEKYQEMKNELKKRKAPDCQGLIIIIIQPYHPYRLLASRQTQVEVGCESS